MVTFLNDLLKFNRSLSGKGNRQTLNYIKENYLPDLNIVEFPCKKNGGQVFNWDVPDEWNANSAYVEDEDGNKIIDFKNNLLHLLGYSESVNKKMTFEELDEHLFSLEDDVDAIPYVTSYYKRRWGFTITHKQREELRKEPGKIYHVVIDTEFNPNGSITYADYVIKGRSQEEILFSTYICHPQMANDNTSSIVVLTNFIKYLLNEKDHYYTYRFVFTPETIGSLIYIEENFEHLKKYVKGGFVLSSIGDNRNYSCVHTPYNNTYVDNVVTTVLNKLTDSPKEFSFAYRGSCERQYNAPLINIPVVTICRTKFAEFSEYHTSKDVLSMNDETGTVTPLGLKGGLEYAIQIYKLLESDEFYRIKTYGEPQLGKYGLYPTVSMKNSTTDVRKYVNIMAYLDGKVSLRETSEILKIDVNEIKEHINLFVEKGLVEKIK